MSRPVHMVAGIGATIEQLLTDENAVNLPLAEVLGRIVGGAWGSRGPDLIDPPSSSSHRGVGHAIVAFLIAFVFIARAIPAWQQALRSKAVAARVHAAAVPITKQWTYQCTPTSCEFLLGFIVGIPTGYVSHLLLDAPAPAALPLLTRRH